MQVPSIPVCVKKISRLCSENLFKLTYYNITTNHMESPLFFMLVSPPIWLTTSGSDISMIYSIFDA
jgi:hypothetical protein